MPIKRKQGELNLQIKYGALQELEKGRPSKDAVNQFDVTGSTLFT